MLLRQNIGGIQLFIPETFPATFQGTVPEVQKHLQGKIIQEIFMCIIDQEKGDPSLSLEPFHESDLVCMDVLKGKRVRGTFLEIGRASCRERV